MRRQGVQASCLFFVPTRQGSANWMPNRIVALTSKNRCRQWPSSPLWRWEKSAQCLEHWYWTVIDWDDTLNNTAVPTRFWWLLRLLNFFSYPLQPWTMNAVCRPGEYRLLYKHWAVAFLQGVGFRADNRLSSSEGDRWSLVSTAPAALWIFAVEHGMWWKRTQRRLLYPCGCCIAFSSCPHWGESSLAFARYL